MPGIAQGLESGLSRKLEGHKNKTEEIELQHLYAGVHQRRIIGKNAEQKPGAQQHHNPGSQGIGRTGESVEADALLGPVVVLCAVVEADDRLRTAN